MSRLQIAIAVVVTTLLGGGALLVWRANARTNKVSLDQEPKLVSFVTAEAAMYQPSRRYIGTMEARAESSIGPQLVSAYLDTVLVRPGVSVKRGQVLATLDCRNATTESKAIAAKVREIGARQQALEDQAQRYEGLLDGGFVAQNEAEQQLAGSNEALAQLMHEQANLASATLQVDDCILRAPFDGEVATRSLDPGAFVRPGMPIVSVVDRSKVIVMVDAPEKDFELLAPSTKVTLESLATGSELRSTIARRAPKADPDTRTVHFEIDLLDPDRKLPVGTTAHIRIDVGRSVPTVRIPLYAAAVREDKVMVFVVDGDVVHQKAAHLDGEAAGQLYIGEGIAPGVKVVGQGRELLSDGDRVSATPELDEAEATADVKGSGKVNKL